MSSRAHFGGLLGAVALVTGCFTVDGSLDASGGGRLTILYPPPKHATVQSETMRLRSEHVRVESVETVGDQTQAVVSFDDVTKLSTAAAFDWIRIFREQDGVNWRLRIVLPGPEPGYRALLRKRAAEGIGHGPRITLELPSPVLDAGRYGVADGSRVTWQIPTGDYANEPWIQLTVTYALAAESAAHSM